MKCKGTTTTCHKSLPQSKSLQSRQGLRTFLIDPYSKKAPQHVTCHYPLQATFILAGFEIVSNQPLIAKRHHNNMLHAITPSLQCKSLLSRRSLRLFLIDPSLQKRHQYKNLNKLLKSNELFLLYNFFSRKYIKHMDY